MHYNILFSFWCVSYLRQHTYILEENVECIKDELQWTWKRVEGSQKRHQEAEADCNGQLYFSLCKFTLKYLYSMYHEFSPGFIQSTCPVGRVSYNFNPSLHNSSSPTPNCQRIFLNKKSDQIHLLDIDTILGGCFSWLFSLSCFIFFTQPCFINTCLSSQFWLDCSFRIAV